MADPIKTDVVVIGAGPGGYAAAFYAADKGKSAILVEQDKRLGGVCMNRGCIPSKALLHVGKLITEAKESGIRGVTFQPPKIDLAQMRQWKESILDKLGQGIRTLGRARKVEMLTGRAHFEDSSTLRVETEKGQIFIKYGKAIIATGSRPALPKAFDLGNPRVMTSTEALDLPDIPETLLVVGGGYIGMEMGTVYAALGSRVTVVEAMNSILLGADPDLVRPVMNYAKKAFKEIRLGVKVAKMATSGKKIKVDMEVGSAKKEELYDRVLVSVGRSPNYEDLGLKNTKVTFDEKGFIKVNSRQETSDPQIMAIGDVAGGAMLAHKASKEARIAVDVLTGENNAFEDIVIPAVIFTDPEVAWCGLTEAEAREKGIPVEIARYSWGASGRALSFDRTDGMTKLVIDPESERILGVGIVGAGAGELISEGVLAVEMGATAADIAESVHPHPTLSETLMECAEVFYGYSTHAVSRKRGREDISS
ncbi:MAG: dihydrolipoyl dehydrogenase [Candidatus Omnitrophica bacterium]|nr:dihydrolipoyl dehydrogenase [Candidatus Omnitrophota bacterium]